VTTAERTEHHRCKGGEESNGHIEREEQCPIKKKNKKKKKKEVFRSHSPPFLPEADS